MQQKRGRKRVKGAKGAAVWCCLFGQFFAPTSRWAANCWAHCNSGCKKGAGMGSWLWPWRVCRMLNNRMDSQIGGVIIISNIIPLHFFRLHFLAVMHRFFRCHWQPATHSNIFRGHGPRFWVAFSCVAHWTVALHVVRFAVPLPSLPHPPAPFFPTPPVAPAKFSFMHFLCASRANSFSFNASFMGMQKCRRFFRGQGLPFFLPLCGCGFAQVLTAHTGVKSKKAARGTAITWKTP